MRMKYCGGSGSNTGTKKVTRCSSWAYLAFRRKYSWWRTTSLSTSSTKIQKASDEPCICKQQTYSRQFNDKILKMKEKNYIYIIFYIIIYSCEDETCNITVIYRSFLRLTLSSHWKSGVMVSSTFRVERVMGCKWTARSSFGNWWTYLWMVLPIFGMRINSPERFKRQIMRQLHKIHKKHL